eukprot:366808-Rhodomonas_salina.1
MQAEAAGTPLFAKSNSELLKVPRLPDLKYKGTRAVVQAPRRHFEMPKYFSRGNGTFRGAGSVCATEGGGSEAGGHGGAGPRNCGGGLRGSEADLKLRLVRAEASRKLPSAHNTNTNTQKIAREMKEYGNVKVRCVVAADSRRVCGEAADSQGVCGQYVQMWVGGQLRADVFVCARTADSRGGGAADVGVRADSPRPH